MARTTCRSWPRPDAARARPQAAGWNKPTAGSSRKPPIDKCREGLWSAAQCPSTTARVILVIGLRGLAVEAAPRAVEGKREEPATERECEESAEHHGRREVESDRS